MRNVVLVIAVLCAVAAVALALRMDARITSTANNVSQLLQSVNDTRGELDALKAAQQKDRATLEKVATALEHPAGGAQTSQESVPATQSEVAEPVQPEKTAPGPAPGLKKAEENVPVGEGLVELQLALPKPMFVGTPRDIGSENLEKVTGRMREPFMVPPGLRNIARGKPVTASDMRPSVGSLEMVTDGDKEGTEGSFVELAPGVQWGQVDLGARYEIFAVVVWHYHSQARVYRDVIACVSDDSALGPGFTMIFNNDHNNTAGLGFGTDREYIETNEGRLIDAKGVKGRYVRLYSNGNTTNDLNHMVEVEVYGRPAR